MVLTSKTKHESFIWLFEKFEEILHDLREIVRGDLMKEQRTIRDVMEKISKGIKNFTTSTLFRRKSKITPVQAVNGLSGRFFLASWRNRWRCSGDGSGTVDPVHQPTSLISSVTNVRNWVTSNIIVLTLRRVALLTLSTRRTNRQSLVHVQPARETIPTYQTGAQAMRKPAPDYTHARSSGQTWELKIKLK